MKKSDRYILAFFILGFLSSRNIAHLLFQFLGEFRIFYANALYRSRGCNKLLDQIFAKLRVSEIGICFQERLLFHG